MEGIRKGGRTRLAPTPSGYLHAGNAINFLITAALARATGSNVMLRIDDLDAERARPEYLEDIFRSLEWLGIGWDEGPSGPADFLERWSQQLRMERYHQLADALRAQGLLFACDCSRSRLRACVPNGRYAGRCRTRGLDLDGADVAWRLDLGSQLSIQVPSCHGPSTVLDLLTAMGDPVLRQRNGRPAYQLASLADDLDFNTTFIVRGMDLLPSSACQLHCADLLGLQRFRDCCFVHHGLLMDETGAKLSKSAGATSLKAMREAGQDASSLQEQAELMLQEMLG